MRSSGLRYGLQPVLWTTVPSEPNATCPLCGAPVWFFRDRRGGCAYFDAIGMPWPKHPCTDNRVWSDSQAEIGAKLAFENATGPATGDPRPTPSAGDSLSTRSDGDRPIARSSDEPFVAWAAEDRVVARSSSDSQRAPAAGVPRLESSSGDLRSIPLAGELPVGPTLVRHYPEPRIDRRWVLGWWAAVSMMLAWFLSLPLSVTWYRLPGFDSIGAIHWMVGLPTVVSFVALAAFLVAVPPAKPTVGRVVGAIVMAPVFLVLGLSFFLFTAALGSLVFAWLMGWQALTYRRSIGTVTDE